MKHTNKATSDITRIYLELVHLRNILELGSTTVTIEKAEDLYGSILRTLKNRFGTHWEKRIDKYKEISTPDKELTLVDIKLKDSLFAARGILSKYLLWTVGDEGLDQEKSHKTKIISDLKNINTFVGNLHKIISKLGNHPDCKVSIKIKKIIQRCKNNKDSESAGQHACPTALSVNSTKKTATLNGNLYPLTERQVEILNALLEAVGGFVPSSKLIKFPGSSEQPSKIIKKLPSEIYDLIESKPGPNGGFRLSSTVFSPDNR